MRAALALLAFVALISAYYPTPGSPAYLNDNSVLQYALTLENLEAAFYTQALTAFTAPQFLAAGFPANTSYSFISIIRDHEVFHARFLTQALLNRGAVPVTPCNYSFTFTDIPTFLAVAAVLEDTGVSAYDGAIGSLSQTDLISTAASIATVEARHAAYIKTLLSQVPFPNVTDVALRADQIFAAAGAFFNGSCVSLNNVTSVTLLNASSFVNPSALNQTVYNQTAAKINDDKVLNYALFLENLEHYFYASVLTNITSGSFSAAGIQSSAYNLIQLIALHEETHANLLRTLLISRGAAPVAVCPSYAFAYPDSPSSVGPFLADAIRLENAGVGAYLGAAVGLTDFNLISLAASITTVEARHAAFLTTLWGLTNSTVLNTPAAALPFPINGTDDSIAQAFILAGVAAFAPGCPLPATFVNADNFRPNTTVATSASGSSSSSSSTSASNSGSSTSATAVIPTASVTNSRSSATATATATATNTQSSRTVTATNTATNSATVTTPRTSVTSTQPASSASSIMLSLALVASVLALAF